MVLFQLEVRLALFARIATSRMSLILAENVTATAWTTALTVKFATLMASVWTILIAYMTITIL